MASIITRDLMVRTGIVVGEDMIGSHRVPNATTNTSSNMMNYFTSSNEQGFSTGKPGEGCQS
jgi:hypothetical protein